MVLRRTSLAATLALLASQTLMAADLALVEGMSLPVDVVLSASFTETPIATDRAEHYRSYSLGLSASTAAPALFKSKYNQNPILSLSLSYSDELGYEDESANFGNSSVSLSGFAYSLRDDLNLSGSTTVILPTNSDAQVYYGYRGSLIGSSSLSWQSPIDKLSLAGSMSLTYANYEFDTSRGGYYNPLASMRLGGSASYKLSPKLGTSVSFSNTSMLLADKSRRDDVYGAALSASYQVDDRNSLSASWSKSDRTYDYDGLSPNINFAYADQSQVTLSVSSKL